MKPLILCSFTNDAHTRRSAYTIIRINAAGSPRLASPPCLAFPLLYEEGKTPAPPHTIPTHHAHAETHTAPHSTHAPHTNQHPCQRTPVSNTPPFHHAGSHHHIPRESVYYSIIVYVYTQIQGYNNPSHLIYAQTFHGKFFNDLTL